MISLPKSKYNDNRSVALIKPLSRSFFKMIEICCSFSLLDSLPIACKSFHLAEGPGGFIEALAYMRKNPKDTAKLFT